jgi:hypothetical protein
MDLEKVLSELRAELAQVEAAIASLERLREVTGVRRRGRPPKVASDSAKEAPAQPQPGPEAAGGFEDA